MSNFTKEPGHMTKYGNMLGIMVHYYYFEMKTGEHMFDKLSIRKKLVISILIGCLIPYFIGSMIIKNKTEGWLYDESVSDSNLALSQTADLVDNVVVKNSEKLVNIIASDRRIVDVGKDINSYVNYDPKTFIRKNTPGEQEISRFLEAIKNSDKKITLVSLGTEQGGYIEYPAFKPKGPYDPRTRDWYRGAIHTDGPVLSEPYMTKVTQDLVVSVDRSVSKDNTKIGVISLSIGLDKLMDDINRRKLGESGHIYILSPNNAFINSPTEPSWLLKTTEELKLDVFNAIDRQNGNAFEGKLGNVDKVFNVYISPYSGWKFVSIMDKSEILAHSRSLTWILYVTYFATLTIMLLLILLISRRITKPILSIAKGIHKMASFQFDKYEYRDFEGYTHQKDEIGEISRALEGMQDNFMELKGNLMKIDEELQSIDISKRSMQKMTLSEDNPFAGIAGSINLMLKKVYDNMEQIRSFNEEISDKNEQLTASEEELKAQLDEIDTQKKFIDFLADHDPLTNLPNRRMFNEKLAKVLDNGGQGIVLLLDLDNFKAMNDTLGHLFGDKVLKHISEILETMFDEKLFVSRFGGDEFLLLYETNDGEEDICAQIQRLFSRISDKFLIDNVEVKIEFSIGISRFPEDSSNMNDLIMYADLALYHVKNTGKHNHAFFDLKMAESIKQKQTVKEILKEAIADNGFRMVYQPQVEIQTGRIMGYEALLRLRKHMLSPAEFIAVAEEDSTIIEIGRIATKMVVEQMAAWRRAGLALRPVSINFSAVQIQDIEFKNFLFALLKEHEVEPEYITIEITESIFLDNRDATTVFLNELKDYGIRIAIDDFGTGYSSLSYLTFLPIDTIKLDRTMNMKFLEMKDIGVMESLIALAHSLKLKIVAEGIEEQEHVLRLAAAQCDMVQGYYYSKPLEPEAVQQGYEHTFGKVHVPMEGGGRYFFHGRDKDEDEDEDEDEKVSC